MSRSMRKAVDSMVAKHFPKLPDAIREIVRSRCLSAIAAGMTRWKVTGGADVHAWAYVTIIYTMRDFKKEHGSEIWVAQRVEASLPAENYNQRCA